jgi:hypothetical protein
MSAITTGSSTYGIGVTIPITLKISNLGSACESAPSADNADVLDGCPYVTAANTSGQMVWNSTIVSPTSQIACTAEAVAGTVPPGWSRTYSFSWNQEECPALGSQCTQAQVPSGLYTIEFAEMGNVWNGINVAPAHMTIG